MTNVNPNAFVKYIWLLTCKDLVKISAFIRFVHIKSNCTTEELTVSRTQLYVTIVANLVFCLCNSDSLNNIIQRLKSVISNREFFKNFPLLRAFEMATYSVSLVEIATFNCLLFAQDIALLSSNVNL